MSHVIATLQGKYSHAHYQAATHYSTKHSFAFVRCLVKMVTKSARQIGLFNFVATLHKEVNANIHTAAVTGSLTRAH